MLVISIINPPYLNFSKKRNFSVQCFSVAFFFVVFGIDCYLSLILKPQINLSICEGCPHNLQEFYLTPEHLLLFIVNQEPM